MGGIGDPIRLVHHMQHIHLQSPKINANFIWQPDMRARAARASTTEYCVFYERITLKTFDSDLIRYI